MYSILFSQLCWRNIVLLHLPMQNIFLNSTNKRNLYLFIRLTTRDPKAFSMMRRGSLILIVIISFCNFVTYCDGFSDMPLYREPTPINCGCPRCPAPSLQRTVTFVLPSNWSLKRKCKYITQLRVEGTAEKAHHMILSGYAGYALLTGREKCRVPLQREYCTPGLKMRIELVYLLSCFRIGGPGNGRAITRDWFWKSQASRRSFNSSLKVVNSADICCPIDMTSHKGNPEWPQACYPTTCQFMMIKGD
uniref:Uncharacterized protein n=1 Tax=Daphnia galeata TaxID=27404 RepID=A0A8J2WK52_9CRUS|nr:unnamed protein product [Daphnia galeata]